MEASTAVAEHAVDVDGVAAEGPPAFAARGATNAHDAPLLFSSTITRGHYHQCGSGRRVKLYVLEGQAWSDRGTGFCAGVYDEDKDEALIVVRKEDFCESLGSVADVTVPEDTQDSDAPPHEYMLVAQESLDSNDVLLNAPVIKEDVYQRQQDTLVVWTELDGSDMALSFQELEGCNEVWDFITEVQQHFALSRGLDYTKGNIDGLPSFHLEDPTLDNIESIEEELAVACLHSVPMRERVVEWLLKYDYVRKLESVFVAAEEQHLLPILYALYGIMKMILSLNDNVMVEYLLQDEVFFSAIGMLEYNPELPKLKASYRQYLQEEAKFHQVVDFDDPSIVTKIKETYRLVYLKDVILAGFADDALQSMLASLVFFYQSDIVNYCVSSDQLWTQLRVLFEGEGDAQTDVSTQRAKGVLFLQHLCTMAKQIQLPGRVSLFRSLIEGGVLPMMECALREDDMSVKNAAAEVLMSVIEYDANSVRSHILTQVEQSTTTLFRLLADLLLRCKDTGLRAQLVESLKILLDTNLEGISNSAMGHGTVFKARNEPEQFMSWLYQDDIKHLFEPLLSIPSMTALTMTERISIPPIQAALYIPLCELLCFVVTQHSYRSQHFLVASGVGRHVGALLHARDKSLRLAAVRVFRACMANQSQMTCRHLIEVDLLGHVLALLAQELPRDNLVVSSCLGLVEQIRQDHIRPLEQHIWEQHRAELERLAEHPLAKASLQPLVTRYMYGHDENDSVDEDALSQKVEGDMDAQPGLELFAAQEAADEADYFDSEEPTTSVTDLADPTEASQTPTELTWDLKRRKDEAGHDDDDEFLARVAKRKASGNHTPLPTS
ncbi:Platinum sensitivity protein [Malassezia pachydermatis]|uniref:Suppressor of mek1 n=1 Tax=Malassezia pachydermatis TaxID=77020 RepID=A0A0M9VQ26_9BASI|nr:suppressor of mek1 [Malassezia pachydermatis]KOS15083.1 suppressor of mek1 [Malassezia pachydermatis]